MTFFYCLGQGFKGIKRNRLFFIASVATIAACIFMIGLFFSVVMNINHMLQEAEESVCVTVFFDEGLSESKIKKIGDDIAGWSDVSRVEYTSAAEAWENFKAEYFANNPDLAEGFANDNPLANSASYDVYLKDITTQREVVARLEATDGIGRFNAIRRAHITATALGLQVDYSGLSPVNIEIPANAPSIPIGNNTDFGGAVFNVKNVNKDSYNLFVLYPGRTPIVLTGSQKIKKSG